MFFLFISVGLLIAAKPYLAVKVYPDNQNIWQDCYAITYGYSKTFFCTDKKLAMLRQFCQHRKMLRRVIYTKICLKNENYILII